jgi:hypothetical protein
MTAPVKRRRKAARPTEADLRRPIEHDEFYDRAKPGPIGGSHNATFLVVDAEGWAVAMVTRPLQPGDPKDDVRQTDLKAIYADKRARFEAARRPGVAVPLPDDYIRSEDDTTTEDTENPE